MAIFIAALTLLGTFWQFASSLLDLRDKEPALVRLVATVDELRSEVRWWQPRRRSVHRKLVRQLLSESSAEARDYRRVQRLLLGWAILSGAATMAVVKEVMAAM